MSEASQSQQLGMWTETELPRQPQPLPSQPQPPRPPRLQPVNRNQLLWHAVDVEKLVGPDHLVRAIWELVGQLDLQGYTAEVGSVEGVAGRPAFYPDKFPYDASTNTCTCPAGKQLPYQTTKHDRVGVERKVYKARAADCRDCAFRQQCRPGAQGRRIIRSENVPVVAAYLTKMRTEAARALYRLRGPVAEFSNLWLKTKLGLRQFGVRGLRKVRCEVLWACLTCNIQQWFRLRWKVRLRPAQA